MLRMLKYRFPECDLCDNLQLTGLPGIFARQCTREDYPDDLSCTTHKGKIKSPYKFKK